MDKPFIIAEVQKAIDKHHFRKGNGYDGISSEHVKFAGPVLVRILTLLYNLVVSSEYIPVNFRRGVQVPLYKGKNQCVLDMNNYRGKTLLTNFNKIFEILVWGRLETWWVGNGKISNLQGTCRKGQSCIHTAFLLQETVSTALERHKSVFVAFHDVSKAFDTVWTDGLFSKLYEMGITGKVWRLFYRLYMDFFCKVKIAGSTSDWFHMHCGIHHEGFLSLIKYIAFIDELIVKL